MNKRKVLDAARKHAQKGAKQKALKEYDKLLAADPRDAKLLLEVGDAYRRWGQVEEAISQYTKVAGQFRQDGFDARAVAVYKQILNLDSKRYETHVSLGELYQHMGLDAEAIGSLQTAADGYHKEGNKPKALELLRKMAALDPSNTTSRMKVADLLKQEGMESDAVAEYGEVADELKRQGALDSVPPVLERILEIQPESTATLAKLADVNLELNRADRAESPAVRLADLAPDSDNLERLCTVYRTIGDDEKLASATRALAKLYRDRGDEDQAREIMQRLPAEAVVEAGGLGSDQSELEEPSLSDDELLDDDEFLLGEESEDLGVDPDPGIGVDDDLGGPAEDQVVAPPSVDANAESSPVIEVPDGDPEQLFAEASVYLRYGKIEQAMASLKGILLQDPDHRGALEKLGEAVAEQENEAGAVAHWRRAAELAAEQGDGAALDLLRDRIRALDPDVADALPTLDAEPAREPEATEPEAGDDLDFELDLDVESEPGTDDVSAEEDADGDAAIELDLDADGGIELTLGDTDEAEDELGLGADDAPTAGADEDGFEIDIEADDDLAAALADASGDTDTDVGADDTIGDDTSEFEIDLDADDAGIELPSDDGMFELPDDDADGEVDAGAASALELDVDAGSGQAISAPADMDTSAGEHSATTAERIEEELEEAEFYLQQDLHAEAEAIYRRILAVAPGHPSALLRLGEIAASQGASPATASEPAVATDDDASLIEAAALDIGLDDADDASEPEGESDVDLDVAFDDRSDESDDSTEVAMLDDEALAAADPPASPLLSEEFADAALEAEEPIVEEAHSIEAPPASEPVAEPVAAVASVNDDAGDSFDLAAELAGAFEEANADDEPEQHEPSETASVLSKVEDGFESIFSDFKKGVSAALEEGDFETRYDLGIAYREMGLYDDAIAEFRVCLDSANRRLESLHLMGLCALDLGRASDAVNHLEQALATPELAEGRKVGIYFDLGRSHEAAGDPARAESVYLEVQALEPNFPGIDERLAAARNGGGAPVQLASEADAGFESFDDLFSEDSDEAEETFESFDDVITSVESESEPQELEPEPEELEAEALIEAEPEPIEDAVAVTDEAEDPPTDPGSSGRRKRKISFV